MTNGITAQRASDGLLAVGRRPRQRRGLHGLGRRPFPQRRQERRRHHASRPTRASRGRRSRASTPARRPTRSTTTTPSVAVGQGGSVHVMWRQRDESGASPLFTDVIDTYYTESTDGGRRGARRSRSTRSRRSRGTARSRATGPSRATTARSPARAATPTSSATRASSSRPSEPPALTKADGHDGDAERGRQGPPAPAQLGGRRARGDGDRGGRGAARAAGASEAVAERRNSGARLRWGCP